jgi:hypothetical protein
MQPSLVFISARCYRKHSGWNSPECSDYPLSTSQATARGHERVASVAPEEQFCWPWVSTAWRRCSRSADGRRAGRHVCVSQTRRCRGAAPGSLPSHCTAVMSLTPLPGSLRHWRMRHDNVTSDDCSIGTARPGIYKCYLVGQLARLQCSTRIVNVVGTGPRWFVACQCAVEEKA